MKTMRSTSLLAVLAGAAIVSPLHAQQLDTPPPPPIDAPDASAEATQLDRERVTMEASHDGLFLKDAQLNEVLQLLALKAERQYFHNASLSGPNYTVTGHLNAGDPLKQMESLAFQFGLELYYKEDTVYALSPQDVQQLPQQEWTYQLKYLRPSDWETLREIVQPILSPNTGSVNFEPKTNTLLVIDTARRIERVEAFLNRLDKPKGQIIVETKILRVTSAAGSRIGVDWSSTLGETGLSFSATQSLNSLFNLPDTRSLVESTTTGNTRSITRATPTVDGITGLAGGSTDISNNDTFTSEESRTSTPGNGLVLAPLQLQAVLRALNDGNLANQKSNPTLITEDNEQALITIIDRVPIITATVSNTSAGSNTTEEVRYTIDEDDPTLSDGEGDTREIGVTLTITPTLLPDNTIRMNLRPRTAQIVEFITGANTGNQYPRVSESMVEAIARVPNGHSLIIGGFYGYADKKSENKVPILGDLPFVGFFFKSKETTKEQTSLVFIITPTSYDPASALENLRANNAIYENVAMDSSHNEIFAPDNPGVAHRADLPNTLHNLALDTKEHERENAEIELIRESPNSEEFTREMEEYETTYSAVKRAQAEETGEVVAPTKSESKKFSGSMFE